LCFLFDFANGRFEDSDFCLRLERIPPTIPRGFDVGNSVGSKSIYVLRPPAPSEYSLGKERDGNPYARAIDIISWVQTTAGCSTLRRMEGSSESFGHGPSLARNGFYAINLVNGEARQL